MRARPAGRTQATGPGEGILDETVASTEERCITVGIMDRLKGTAKKAAGEHGDKVSGATEKVGDFVDRKTEGKYTDKIDQGKKKVNEAVERLDGKDDPGNR